MYRSWIPAGLVGQALVALPMANRQNLARTIARVAQEFDWPVCNNDAGIAIYRYYSDINWVVDPVQGIQWLPIPRPVHWGLKEAFSLVFARCRGEPLLRPCFVVGFVLLKSLKICYE